MDKILNSQRKKSECSKSTNTDVNFPFQKQINIGTDNYWGIEVKILSGRRIEKYNFCLFISFYSQVYTLPVYSFKITMVVTW